jgi:hypothetical protein
MQLNALQDRLCELYDIESLPLVEDFLISVPDALPAGVRRDLTEQLLVIEDDTEAYVGLYLEPHLHKRVMGAREITPVNLSDWSQALEGISHFLYVMRAAAVDRPVSRLELELQAEIDRFALLWFMLEEQGERPNHRLYRRLFERFQFDPALSAADYEIYRLAHRYGARYCRYLEESFSTVRSSRRRAITQELRRVYRLSLSAKMRCIGVA